MAPADVKPESSGRITLDPVRGARVLRQHAALHPRLYVLDLVRCAVLNQAHELRFTFKATAAVAEFDGPPLALDAEPFRLLFEPAEPRLKRLASALNTALALDPLAVRVESWEGTRGQRLTLRADEVEFESVVRRVPWTGNRFELRERRGLSALRHLWDKLHHVDVRHGWKSVETTALRERCRLVPLTLWVNRRVANRGIELGRGVLAWRHLEHPELPLPFVKPRAHGVTEPAPGEFTAVLFLEQRATGPSRVTFLAEGVEVATVSLTLGAAGVLRGWVWAPGLRLDASGTDLVRNREFEEFTALLEAQLHAMIADLGQSFARWRLPPLRTYLLELLAAGYEPAPLLDLPLLRGERSLRPVVEGEEPAEPELEEVAARAVLERLLTHRAVSPVLDRFEARDVRIGRGGRYLAAVTWDGWAHVWEVASGRLVGSVWEELAVHRSQLALQSGSSRLVVASGRTLRLWDVQAGVELWSAEAPADVEALDFSPDGVRIVTACGRSGIHFWCARTGHRLRRWGTLFAACREVQYSPDGSWLAARFALSLMLARADTGRPVCHLRPGDVWSFSGDGRSVAASIFDLAGTGQGAGGLLSYALEIVVIDLASGERLFRLPADPGSVQGLALNGDGSLLAVLVDGQLAIHHVPSGQVQASLPATACAWLSRGRLAVADADGVRLLQAPEWRPLAAPTPASRRESSPDTHGVIGSSDCRDRPAPASRLESSPDTHGVIGLSDARDRPASVSRLEASPDGAWLLVDRGLAGFGVWEPDRSSGPRVLGAGWGFLSALQVDDQGRVFCQQDRHLYRWQMGEAPVGHELEPNRSLVSARHALALVGEGEVVILSHDFEPLGRIESSAWSVQPTEQPGLVILSQETHLQVWDYLEGKLLWQDALHDGLLMSAAVREDALLLSDGASLSVRGLRDGRRRARLACDEGVFLCGDYVVLQGKDGLDVRTVPGLKPVRSALTTGDSVTGFPARPWLLTWADERLRLWNVETGAPLWETPSPAPWARCSPDGRLVVTGSGPLGNETLSLWQTADDRLDLVTPTCPSDFRDFLGDHLLGGGPDRLHLYSLQGQRQFSLFFLDGGWAAVAPDGRCTGTPHVLDTIATAPGALHPTDNFWSLQPTAPHAPPPG